MPEDNNEQLHRVLANLPEGSLEYIKELGIDMENFMNPSQDEQQFDPKDDEEIDSFSAFNLGLNPYADVPVESEKVVIQEDDNPTESFDDIGLF